MKSGIHLSRRSFLKRSAFAGGALAAPLILPGRLFGADAPSKKTTVGLIGMGRQMMNVNLPGFLAIDTCRVVAVCDVDAWRLGQAKTKVDKYYGDAACATHGDFRELIARKDLDAVMIATPDHWHVPMAIATVRAGKDVSCEKPLTLSIREGRLLADEVKKHDRVFRTDSEFRSNKLFHHLASCVRSGRIGRIKAIHTGTPKEIGELGPQAEQPVPEGLDYAMWLGPAPEAPYHLQRVHPRNDLTGRPGWMRNLDYCEGMVANWGTHLNDIAQWAHNTDRSGPVEVEATGVYPPKDHLWNVLTSFQAKYRYADGVELTYKMAHPFIRIEGEEGWIEYSYGAPKLLASDEKVIAKGGGPGWVEFVRKSDKEDFIDAVRSRGPTMEDAEVGHRTCSMCQLAHISIKLGGRKLSWNPDTEQFTDPEANKLLDRPSWRGSWMG